MCRFKDGTLRVPFQRRHTECAYYYVDMNDLPWPTEREEVAFDQRTFLIDRPANAERLQLASDLAEDGYTPYWAALWPGARMLSQAILAESWTAGTSALEIGCGLGLAGIVALSAGLRVTFSDYDPPALLFAAHNARLNGFTDFETLCVDWRSPPDGLHASVLLASDLVYELRNIEPLVAFIKRFLKPGGICLMADQDRLPSPAMRQALEDSCLTFTVRNVRVGEPGERRVKGSVYRIQ